MKGTLTVARATVSSMWLTLLIIVINVFCFFSLQFLDLRAYYSFSVVSLFIDWGGNISALTLAGEAWRLLTSMFLHIDHLHLLMNMLALASIGSLLEKILPRWVWLAIYFLSGLAGSIASALYNQGELVVSVGASGAILGLVGALLVCALFPPRNIPWKNLLMSLFLTFGAGLLLPVDNVVHVVGLVTGAVLSLAWNGLFHSVAKGRYAAKAFGATGAVIFLATALAWQHNNTPNGQAQMMASDVIFTLAGLGLGNSEQQKAGTDVINRCLADKVRHLTSEESIDTSTLTTCYSSKEISAYSSEEINTESLSAYLVPALTSCRKNVPELKKTYIHKGDLALLDKVANYCDMKWKLYGAALNFAPTEILTVTQIEQAYSDGKSVASSVPYLNKPGRYPFFSRYQEELLIDQPVSDRVFQDIPAPLFAAMEEGRCPYNSCSRPLADKIAELFK